ncbi:unnamed protein product [Ectocarpus sp. CCAP 1310/34]|nr:unnamed protein product [Ectocarpus sp. CCAP 1310/34]
MVFMFFCPAFLLLTPPPPTPRRYGPKRGASAAAVAPVLPTTPGSPIAVAARVISQEESVRSTLRMKRAAEAIALEDARILAEVKRQEEQRRRQSEHRVAASPPLPRTKDDHGDDPAEEEEDARARGSLPSNPMSCCTLCPCMTKKQAEKMRVRALRVLAAREEAEIDQDRALALTLEVLRRKHADKRRGVSTLPSVPGNKRAHSPPRKSRRPDNHRTTLARRVKDSAARLCGLSQAQVLLLRRSRKLGREGDAPRTVSERRTEQLAQPKEHRPATRTRCGRVMTLVSSSNTSVAALAAREVQMKTRWYLVVRRQLASKVSRNPATDALVEELTKTMTDKEKRAFLHACLADAKECTHRPYTRSAAAVARHRRGGAGDGATGGGEEAKDGSGPGASIDAFLYRMDAQERAKNAAMEHRRGELAYKAVLDKRVCPDCGAEQSYDEVEEKRKICPNCEAEYRKPKTWASVRKIRTFALGSHRSYDGAEGERLFWEDIEDDFFCRLQHDAARRQASLESRSAALYQDWTFRPTLSAASERVVDESAWAGSFSKLLYTFRLSPALHPGQLDSGVHVKVGADLSLHLAATRTHLLASRTF